MIIGRSPLKPSQPKKLTISLQVGSALSRELAEQILSCQRADFGGFELSSFAGKLTDRPNILPHHVKFLEMSQVVVDHTTDVIVLTHGALSQQFEYASQAITAGKHVVLADARLLQAYGDILHKMADAYGVQIGVGATLLEQSFLAQLQPQFSVQGVEHVLWCGDDTLNRYLAEQELTERTLEASFSGDDVRFIHAQHQARNHVLSGLFFNKWEKRKISAEVRMPSVHDHRIAARLNGVLRYVSQVTEQGACSGLYFLPNSSAVAHTANTTEIVLKNGFKQVLSASSSLDESVVTAQAVLQDVLRISQSPRVLHQVMEKPVVRNKVLYKSLFMTNTANWRALKEVLDVTVVSESFLGTTLIVTLEHEKPLDIDFEYGSLYALAQDLPKQQSSYLRLAV